MKPLEANIVSIIPDLSEEAKDAIRSLLGDKPKMRKRKVVVTAEQAKANMLNHILKQRKINRLASDS